MGRVRTVIRVVIAVAVIAGLGGNSAHGRRESRAERAAREQIRKRYAIDSARDERARLARAKRHKPSLDQPRHTFAALRAAVLLRDRTRALACLTAEARDALDATWPQPADWDLFYRFMGTRYYGQESEGDQARVILETKVREVPAPAAPTRRRSILPMRRVDDKWLITDGPAVTRIGAPPPPAQGPPPTEVRN